MVGVDLARYDGGAGVLVDTTIWIDCIDASSSWHEWAVDEVQRQSERAPLHVNLIIYTELLIPAPDAELLDEMLAVFDVRRSSLPWSCAALAAAAFKLYRSRGGAKAAPLPDFFIGAHAAVANLSVLTRDPAGYTSYFPRLAVLGP